MRLACPNCGSEEFKAIEQISATTTCRFDRTDGGIEIEQEAKGEFVREDATSVIVAYICKGCDRGFDPIQIQNLLVEKQSDG